MVTVLAMLDAMSSDGMAKADLVAEKFKQFYEARQEYGKIPEAEDKIMSNPLGLSLSRVKSTMLNNPVNALKDFLYFNKDDDILVFREQVLAKLDPETKADLRKTAYTHLYRYYKQFETPQITLKELESLPLYFAVTAIDIANLSGQNQMKGIHPIDRDGIKTVVVLCTLNGDSYPNQWLNKEKTRLKYYLEGRKQAASPVKIYNEQSSSNQAVINSQRDNYSVHVFTREKKGDLFHYAGPFVFLRVVMEDDGDKYFELGNLGQEENRMSLPEVSREVILKTMKRFDRDKRDDLAWQGWEEKKNQLYAILHEGRKYPPKAIISMATGVPVSSFSGGEQSNTYLRKRGFEIITLNKETPPGENSATDTEPGKIVENIFQFIMHEGFVYDYPFIANFFLSLKTKPFVILAGISGTGKSKLVEKFAAAMGATNKNGRFHLIPVRPDWSDSSDLLGYRNLQGDFIAGPMMQVIEVAEQQKEFPVFVCLDEMNLARVEYYFSDFLSIIEFRRKNGQHIESSALRLSGISKEVTFPENLYVIGTVNMDETTHSFSRKVLDRANTIEFAEVHLDKFPSFKEIGNDLPKEVPALKNHLLRSEYLTLKDCVGNNESFLREKVQILQKLNEILQPGGLHVGYRVRDEFLFYLLYNKEWELISEEEAIDFQIMQKVLPRIQGNSAELEKVLNKLLEFCGERYPRSRIKCEFMLGRFRDDGFTSFWL